MVRAPHRSVPRRAWWALVAAVVLSISACSGGSSSSGNSGQGGNARQNGGNGQADVAAATVQIQPAKGAAGVAPAAPVVVTAGGGTLTSVRVKARSGGTIEGRFDSAKASWRSITKLDFGTTYQVSAVATNSAGKQTTSASTFSTATARAELFPSVSPLRGSRIGVGLPIRVYFDAPVADRKAAVANMKVTTSTPTEGAWRWFSSTEVHWRPKVYWKAGTDVALDTTLRGVNLGGGVYGGPKADRHIEFRVGSSLVSVVNAKTHQMKVYQNGKLIRTIPVSLGKEVPGRYTKSGPHVVIEKNRVKKMDSTTFGLALDAGGYRANVEWATRVSNNGEFVHSAPWSVAQQGHTNVSHGCINASPANAKWFFNLAKIGDVVEVVGTPVKLGWKDGDIYDWSIPWSQWAN
jgi:lipoprotein-anchoring transpeptidase ErfK/SrfK